MPKGHVNKTKTHCPYGHAYAGKNLYIPSGGGRGCRKCRRVNGIRHRARQRGEPGNECRTLSQNLENVSIDRPGSSFDVVRDHRGFDGDVVKLSRKYEDVLFLFMCRRRVSRDDLIECLWPDPDDEPEFSWAAVGLYVFELNAKIAHLKWRIIGIKGPPGGRTLERLSA